jgi:hypothetical protein
MERITRSEPNATFTDRTTPFEGDHALVSAEAEVPANTPVAARAGVPRTATTRRIRTPFDDKLNDDRNLAQRRGCTRANAREPVAGPAQSRPLVLGHRTRSVPEWVPGADPTTRARSSRVTCDSRVV